MKIEHIDKGLHRILVPFEDLTTTVYVVVSCEGVAIIDSATYPSDVDQYILPGLQEFGISQDEVRYLLLTHKHGDHAGGIYRLAECFPYAKVRASFELSLQEGELLADGERFLGCLQTVSLPGHTKNSVGFYDVRTKTLLSGDCLQLKGIGKYRNGVSYPDLYKQSIERLRQMDIARIVAAHEYDPLGSLAEGKAAVVQYLKTCLDVLIK